MGHHNDHSSTFSSRRWVIIGLVVAAFFLVWSGDHASLAQIHGKHSTNTVTNAESERLPVSAPSSLQPSLEETMFGFFQMHPDPDVRDELPKLIRSFQMRTNWKPTGVAAAFTRYPDSKHGGEVVSVLIMSRDLFEARNRAHGQMVVYHEYQHYLQWRDGAIPEEAFLYVSWTDNDLPRICKQKWYAEVEAYQKECEFGRQGGLLEQLDPHEGLAHICAATQEQFASTLKRILPLGDPSAKVCASTWNAI
jgi:hypothetical protein